MLSFWFWKWGGQVGKKITLYVHLGQRKNTKMPPERRGLHFPTTATVSITWNEIMKAMDQVKNPMGGDSDNFCIIPNVCEILSRAEVAGCTDEDIGISTVLCTVKEMHYFRPTTLCCTPCYSNPSLVWCILNSTKHQFISSVRSSNNHPDLLLTQHHHPLFQITPVLNTRLSLSEPLQLYKGYNAI